MLYHLFEILESQFNLPGASLFGYLSFRAAVTVIMALLISIVFGKKIINYLKVKQVGENIRELGLDGEKKKAGTPTMGGIIIIIGTLVPVILMSNLENIYIQILIISSLILGTIGLIDDYIKVFKKDKKGLHGKFKIAGQSLLGIFVGIVLLTNNNITIVEFDKNLNSNKIELSQIEEKYPEVDIQITKNLPFEKYLDQLNQCDILLDQVFAYDQGYNALEAMALGKVVFTGAEDEFLSHYSLEEDEVAINALPDVNYLVEKLSTLIGNPKKIIDIGINARAFIKKHHEATAIAKKYVDTWQKAMSNNA